MVGALREGILEHEAWQGDPYRLFVLKAWVRNGQKGWPPAWDQATGTIDAYINHGRWIAECPCGDGFAIVPSKADPYFFCPRCANASTNDSKPFRVAYPANADAIEAVLMRRPEEHRNWLPGEPLASLIRENSANGLEY